MNRKLIASFVVVALFVGGFFGFTGTANAINPAAFDPGRIIDDAIFYDPGGMGNVNDIQNFLNAHTPSCDTFGTRASGYGNLNNAQYAQQVKGWPGPPYACLNNYHENPNTGETSYERGGGAFPGGLSSAQIIYNAAQTYRINPKVLLVLLRKESLNLFSDSWPLKSQYKYAMGYGCPDSGPNYSANCDITKAGFYKQMTLAAKQLRMYYDNMGSYNYAPGRWNTIQYSPQPSCGTKNVYIQNYATASLYIYTPYVPNDAALNAYPGTANCGAYGNRNFWFFWQEWFGSTITNGNFLRSANDATVYLVGDKVKYPVGDVSILGAASSLGGVGFVSQSYLDNVPTGSLMSRIIQGPDGTIYFYDTNIKLPFTSCEMVAAYGASCGSAAELTQAQIDKFVTGPLVTKGMKTTSGRTYYIDGGTKREVLDDQSLSEAGISVGFNMLTDSAFSYLAYGQPIVRSGVVLQSRQDSSMQLLKDNNSMYQIKRSQTTDSTFSSIGTKELDGQSIQRLPTPINTIGDSIVNVSGVSYILTNEGKRQVVNAQSLNLSPIQLSNSLVAQLNGTGSLSTPPLLKSLNDATVYVIVNGEKRPLVAMEDLKSITGEDSPYLGWVTSDAINAIPTGNIIIGAGRLVKTPSNATIYTTDGYDKLIPMSSFDSASDLGVVAGIRVVSDSILAKYTIQQTVLSSYVSCGSTNYAGIGGTLYEQTLGSHVAQSLQPQTCNILTKSTQLPRFLHAPGGTIFEYTNGTIKPITSWTKYVDLLKAGGTGANVSQSTLNLFTVGSPI